MTYFRYFLVLVLTLLVSCASPKLTNNDRGLYKRIVLDDPKNVLEVKVSAIPIPKTKKKPKEKPKTFFDLRDSIPNKFLEVIGKKSNSTKEIIDAIKADLSEVEEEKKEEDTEIDENTYKIRLLFSNIKKYYNKEFLLHPNTRLEFLNTSIEIKNPEVYIYSIDKLENEFEEIDLGTLERTQSVNFNSKLSGEYGVTVGQEDSLSTLADTGGSSLSENIENVYDSDGNLIGAVKVGENSSSTENNSSGSKTSTSISKGLKGEVSYANAENIKENLALKYKKIKTGFSFSPHKLTVSQRGRPLSDISDNVFVTLTLKWKNQGLKLDTKRVSVFADLFKKNKDLNKIDDVKINQKYVHYPPCHSSSDVNLEYNYEGAIRGVKNLKRGRSGLEFDDKVSYYVFEQKSIPETITIENSEFCRNIYKIEATFSTEKDIYTLHFDSQSAAAPSDEVLVYEEDDLRNLKKWMLGVILKKDKNILQSTKHNLVFINPSGTKKIHLSKPSMTIPEIQKLSDLNGLRFVIRKK